MTIEVITRDGRTTNIEADTRNGRVYSKGHSFEKKENVWHACFSREEIINIFGANIPKNKTEIWVKIKNQEYFEKIKKQAKEEYYNELRKTANNSIIEKVIITNHSYYKLSVNFVGVENQEYHENYNKVSSKIKKYWNEIEEILSEKAEKSGDYDDYNDWTDYTIGYEALCEILRSLDTKKIDNENDKIEEEKRMEKDIYNIVSNIVFSFSTFDNSFGENPEGEWMTSKTKNGKSSIMVAMWVIKKKYSLTKSEALKKVWAIYKN